MKKYFTWVVSLTISTYLIIAISLVILLTGCSEFPINAKQGTITNQLNCEPAESNGCAGWLPPDEIVVIE
tara:strand:- start:28 stop:237 length:210 start_codon:yes stop_codon:yes gene_type:complete